MWTDYIDNMSNRGEPNEDAEATAYLVFIPIPDNQPADKAPSRMAIGVYPAGSIIGMSGCTGPHNCIAITQNNGAFKKPIREIWLPVPPGHGAVAVELQVAGEASRLVAVLKVDRLEVEK